MFVKVKQASFGTNSKEWYWKSSYINLDKVIYAETVNHKVFGVAMNIVFRNHEMIVKITGETKKFPECVSIDRGN